VRYFTCLLVALCISASTLYAADANGQQLSRSERQQVSKQGTQNPEAHELYLKGRSYWAKRTRADLETAVSYRHDRHHFTLSPSHTFPRRLCSSLNPFAINRALNRRTANGL
jgi:hypothetical protein